MAKIIGRLEAVGLMFTLAENGLHIESDDYDLPWFEICLRNKEITQLRELLSRLDAEADNE